MPETASSEMFELIRDQDESGVSGTGLVAVGVVFPDGTVAMRWVAGQYRSTAVYQSIAHVREIHGHGGKTRIRYTAKVVHRDAR